MAVKTNKQLIRELTMGDDDEWKVFGESFDEEEKFRKSMRDDLESSLAGIGDWDGANRQKSLLIGRLTDPMLLIESYLDQHGLGRDEKNRLLEKIGRVRGRERGD